MKKAILLGTIIAIVLSILLLSIPKHELPTDEEWEAYLEELEYSRPSVDYSHCSPVQ